MNTYVLLKSCSVNIYLKDLTINKCFGLYHSMHNHNKFQFDFALDEFVSAEAATGSVL